MAMLPLSICLAFAKDNYRLFLDFNGWDITADIFDDELPLFSSPLKLMECFLHDRCIPHQNSIRPSKCVRVRVRVSVLCLRKIHLRTCLHKERERERERGREKSAHSFY